MGKSNVSDQEGSRSGNSKTRAGNPGYGGYEYQIEVTIWIALDLMLAKAGTDGLNIEPPSHEDVEASVKDPDNALLDMTAQDSDWADIFFQIKTRSNSPWSAADLASILTGKASGRGSKSRRRACPLQILKADPRRRYVFVTNEGLTKSLRPHQGQGILDFPDVTELPPYARRGQDSAAQADLAPRLLLCSGVTEEVLRSRVERLLSRHGHVPSVDHIACLQELREEVRNRIRGLSDGRWTRAELVAVLARHGGSVAPTRAMDRYVRPRSFDRIRDKLDQSHAVVIGGPSGTGKTLTAEILEAQCREADPPFSVVGEEHGPGHIRHRITQPGATLFHLRDPWGSNRLAPGAERWSGELPKLLHNAGPERKFIITSRSDILQSAGPDLMKALEPYTISIEIEDYGGERLEKIYDGIASDLVGHARSLACDYRVTALKSLQRPYEIDRFLVALSREDARKARKAEDIVSDSQIDAISGVIAAQIEPMGDDGVASAAIIWALLVAREAVHRQVFAKLLRRVRVIDSSVRPDVEGLIDFLIAGRNLRRDGTCIALYHPKVEEGLQKAFMCRRGEAEHVLSIAIDGLAAMDDTNEDWGIETGLAVCSAAAKLDGIQLSLRPATQARLDKHLGSKTLRADRRFDFRRALADLARFGSEEHPPSRVARVFVDDAPDTVEVSFGNWWQCPPLAEAEIVELRKDARTTPLIERFVSEVLPFSGRSYDPSVVELVLQLAPNIGTSFWDALDAVAGPGGPNENIEAIVAGACADDSPDFDRVVARFARSEAEANVWFEKEYAEEERQAEEHEVDAVFADHVLEQPDERYYNARTGMKTIVRLRGEREGFGWIVGHRHRQLLVAAAAEWIGERSHAPRTDDLRLLLESAEGWTRGSVWRAINRHCSADLSDLVRSELTREGLDSGIRSTLVEIAAKIDEDTGELVPLLAEIVPEVSPGRQLELVFDLFHTSLDDDGRGESGAVARRVRAERLCETLTAPEDELGRVLVKLLSGEAIASASREMSGPAVSKLASLVLDVSHDVAGPLICAAAAVGVDVIFATKRLLKDGDADDGAAAVKALLIDGGEAAQDVLRDEALGHRRYRVRRAALKALLEAGDPTDRDRVLAVSKDRSADVRLAWARLMQQYKWPEAVCELVRLMGDQRDFSSDPGYSDGASWSEYRVARAAAHALGAYDDLPESAVTALIETAEEESQDPFVACAAISAIANKDDGRICDAINVALDSSGINRAPEYRPLAQAAAWSLFDRTVADRPVRFSPSVIRMAVEGDPVIAGPLLMAAGVIGGDTKGVLVDRLGGPELSSRTELLEVSELIADPNRGVTSEGCKAILAKLAGRAAWEELSEEEQAELQAWASGLNPSHDVDRFTVWALKSALSIPLVQEVDEPRAYKLPQRIGVLTMRSLSPAREEGPIEDDGF